jgi:hypothetical protein
VIGFFQAVRPLNNPLFQVEIEFAKLVKQLLVLLFEMKGAPGIPQRLDELVCMPWLEEKAVDTRTIDGLDRILELGEASHQKAHGPRCVLARPGQQIDPFHARHLLIGQNNIDRPLLQNAQRCLAAVRSQNIEVVGKKGSESRENVRLVINDK